MNLNIKTNHKKIPKFGILHLQKLKNLNKDQQYLLQIREKKILVYKNKIIILIKVKETMISHGYQMQIIKQEIEVEIQVLNQLILQL